MATDKKAIQNQKVFVQLGDVTEVQASLLRLIADKHDGTAGGAGYLRGIAYVIKTLGLPIDTGKF